jgi:hypothetical protein
MEIKKKILCATHLPMTPSDVYHIMGLQIDGSDIVVHDNIEINKELFYAYKSQSPGDNPITLKALEHKSKYPDDHFIRQFILYTIRHILAPTTKEHVHSKYLAIVDDILHFNWGQFTLCNLLSCLQSFKEGTHKNLQGNLALLQVLLLNVKPYRQMLTEINICSTCLTMFIRLIITTGIGSMSMLTATTVFPTFCASSADGTVG